MQHKRSFLRSGTLKLSILGVIVVVITVLMTAHPVAVQHPVEKELDAKAFLEQKQ